MIPVPDFEILIATYNPGKVREVQQALDSLNLKIRQLNEFPNAPLVDEVGKTYEENAVLKAVSYAKQTGVTALADDSGLEVDALEGKPGLYSARFGGENISDHTRIEKLLAALAEHKTTRLSARFVCCMALAGWHVTEERRRAEGPRLLMVTEATCEGVIAPTPRGINGFGFDAVFVPEGYLRTFAELSADVKAAISHRAKALTAVREFLNTSLRQT